MATLTIPTNPDDLRDFLADDTKVAQAFANAEESHKFIEQYRKEVTLADASLDEQTKDDMQTQLKTMLESNGWVKSDANSKAVKRLPMGDSATSGGNRAIYNNLGMDRKTMRQIAATGKAPGVGLAHQWEDVGDFTLAALRNMFQNVPDTRLKDLSEVIPGDGGLLVPEEFRAELMMLALESAVVRPRANVIPMGGASLRFPAIKDTTHASNVFGGVVGTWVAEGGSVSSSTNQPTFSAVRLVANKLVGYSVASNELRTDSAVSLEALINTLYPAAISYFEDDAFIQGTGAGQPLGILNADALISVGKETGQAAKTVVWENILNMYSRMLPQSLNTAVWLAHNDTFPQLASMSLTVGTAGSAVWLSNGVGGPPVSILGRPVLFTEKCKTVGTAGDLYFVDLSQYLIGDRQSLTMAQSEHVLFTTDEYVWRFIARLDGRPWVASALTPRNGSTTVSPYITVATRA